MSSTSSSIAYTATSAKKVITLTSILMCTLGAVFYFYEYYLRVAPSVMNPSLKSAFNISEAGFGTLAAFYYWAYVPLQMPVGLMMDRWGPRRILTLACLLCVVGTYFFASTNILSVAQMGRFLIGFGSAFAYVGVLKIASIWLPRKYFALTAGLCCGLGMLGAMSGEIVMARMVDWTGWRNTLMVAGHAGLLLTLILWLVVRDENKEQTYPRKRYKKIELKAELLEVIKNPTLWANGAIGCLAFLPLTIFAELWAVKFMMAYGWTKHQATFGSSLVFLGFGIGGPLWGICSDQLRSRRIPLMFGSLCASVFAFMIVFALPTSLTMWYCLLFGMGLFASAQVLVFAVGNDICRPELSATTASFTNMIVMLGGLLLAPLVGVILDWLTPHHAQKVMHNPTFIDFQYALLLLPVGLLLAGLLSVILKESFHIKRDD